MTAGASVDLTYNGSASEPVDWSVVEAIFVSLFGESAKSLDKFPKVIGGTWANWQDAQGIKHEADTLQDVEEAYRRKETYMLSFSNLEGRTFAYRPGGEPRAESVVRASSPDEAAAILAPVREAFPLQRTVVFLSWSGSRAKRVAMALRTVLESRLPVGGEVFFSPDMTPGVDPLREMVDRNLLATDAHMVVVTPDAAQSHWVTWEVATSWGRSKLVVPIFVGVRASDLNSPLKDLIQGVRLDDDEQLRRGAERVLAAVGGDAQNPLSDEELTVLRAAGDDETA